MVSRAKTGLSNEAMAKYCLEYNAPALGFINQNYLGGNKNSNEYPGIKFPKYTESAQIPESMATTITNISRYYQGNPSAIRESMMNEYKANIAKFKPYNYLDGEKGRTKVLDRDNQVLNGFRQGARDKVDNNFINLSQGIDVIKKIIETQGIKDVALPTDKQSTNGSTISPFVPKSTQSLRSSQAPSNTPSGAISTIPSRTDTEKDYIENQAMILSKLSNKQQSRYLTKRVSQLKLFYGNDFNQKVGLKASDVQSKSRATRIEIDERMSLFVYQHKHLGLPPQQIMAQNTPDETPLLSSSSSSDASSTNASNVTNSVGVGVNPYT
jgi:hypothetical protein